MFEDLRGYLQLATGLSEVTAAKAKDAAMALVSHGLSLTTKAPDVVGQVQELTDDLLSTSKSNREALLGLIRSEVDRAVGRMGFVREDELSALRRHVERLEQQVRDLGAAGATRATGATAAPAGQAAPSSEDATAASAANPTAPGADPPKPKKKKVVTPTEGLN